MPRHVPRSLGHCSLVLVSLLVGHDLTHAFDDGLHTKLSQLALVSTPQWVAIAAVMWVILRAERRFAAVGALLLGAGTVVGFGVVHLLPFALSSFWDLHPSAVSWILVWVPTGVGALLAELAWSVLREPAAERAVAAPT